MSSNAFDELNIGTTILHTDMDRERFEHEMAESEMPAVRTRMVKEAVEWLNYFREKHKGGNERLQYARDDEEKIARIEKEMEMYNYAISIWAAEVGLFLRDLQKELADTLEDRYGDIAKKIAAELRE